MNHFRPVAIAAAGGALLTAVLSTHAYAAGPEIVAGPAADAGCFAPWTDKTKFFKFLAKKGPYRIALANGYIANTWRIQMIQTAKAYAVQPDVAAKLKEFKVVSTGDDVAAQIAA
ncbi:MAG TPA: ribose ABC transporter substrate-binding protein, partial [Roseiarcus sp.]|nr:ribose ABC transporter substrate-binding protein [Roseiarcus sp.]